MYVLQNNVDIVRGAKYHCIYDLNSRKLYHLDSGYLQHLNTIIEDESSYLKAPPNVLNYFVDAGIVVTKDNLLAEIPRYEYSGQIDFVWVEITQRCNIFCRHCYEYSSQHSRTNDMTMEDYRKAIDSLVEIGVPRIQLVGGEPLTHSKIKEMIAYASGKFSYIEVFTNGTLLTDELLGLFKQHNIALAFSVYADTPSIHDLVTRVSGSYKDTINNIKKSIDKGIRVRISSVEMKDVPRFGFFDSSVEHRTDFPRLTGRANLALYDRDMLLRKIITKTTFKVPINVDRYLKSRIVHNCFGDKLYISNDLNVYPCSMERRCMYGNLHSSTLNSILSSSLSGMTKDNIRVCKDCEFRYACFDCRPDSNGSPLDSKPWYCTYDPYEGVWSEQDTFINSLSV